MDQLSVGVIVGRFQTPEFHEGHRELFETVRNRHQRWIVFLGVPPQSLTRKDPLDFATRAEMFRSCYPDAIVLALPDRQTDEQWSRELDSRILEIFPQAEIVLYGGRDSFVPRYKGGFQTREVLNKNEYSATALREAAAVKPLPSADFRKGCCYSIYNGRETVVPCVDVAILKHDENLGLQVLLVMKPEEQKFRFVGGHVEADDPSLEKAAQREAREETGVEPGPAVYIGSCPVDDWRLRGTNRVYYTSLFMVKYLFGAVRAAGDVNRATWVVLDELEECSLEPYHVSMLRMLKEYVQEKGIAKVLGS